MISSAFWMAGKIPSAGKIATKVLADSNLEAKSKDFANKYFNPFCITNKLAAAKTSSPLKKIYTFYLYSNSMI